MVAAATAGSVVAAKAVAQSSAQPSPAAPATPTSDFEKQARDNVKNNADALAKFALPMAVEPSFQFKA
jgi:hypothetical protein